MYLQDPVGNGTLGFELVSGPDEVDSSVGADGAGIR